MFEAVYESAGRKEDVAYYGRCSGVPASVSVGICEAPTYRNHSLG